MCGVFWGKYMTGYLLEVRLIHKGRRLVRGHPKKVCALKSPWEAKLKGQANSSEVYGTSSFCMDAYVRGDTGQVGQMTTSCCKSSSSESWTPFLLMSLQGWRNMKCSECAVLQHHQTLHYPGFYFHVPVMLRELQTFLLPQKKQKTKCAFTGTVMPSLTIRWALWPYLPLCFPAYLGHQWQHLPTGRSQFIIK